MHGWFRTRSMVPSLLTRLIPRIATVVVTVILLGLNIFPQSDSGRPGMSPNELARRIIANELKFQADDHSHWIYRLEKEESKKKQIQEICETKDGSLSRLLSIDGRALSAKQEQKENQRLQRLVSHPDEQRILQQASNKKAEQGARLFRSLPDVFVFAYAHRQGNFVTLTFKPNPNFQPPSIEARVLHSMQGEMTVETTQQRLTAISGHLMEDVKFGGGLLGNLDKGGNFEVRQTEVVPWHWEITVLSVNMKGKALLFKTIGAHEIENHSDFHRVPDDITLAGARDILSRQIVVADNR